MAKIIRKLKKEDWFHPDGFPVAIGRRDPQEPFGLHAHEFSEIVIITGGHGLHVTGTEAWPLSAGDVFVISGSRPHDYHNLDHLSLINVMYDPEKLRMDLLDLTSIPGYHALFTLEPAWRQRHRFKSRLRLCPKDLGIVTGMVDQLEKELQNRPPGFAFFATASFMQVIGFLSRCSSQSRNSDAYALRRIAEAITHLEVNAEQPIDLKQLASIAHMSRRTFLRAFRAAMGNSPISYLIQVRVNRAAALLRETDQSITEIAFKTGFADSNYFSRQFSKVLGLSPRIYRKQYSRGA